MYIDDENSRIVIELSDNHVVECLNEVDVTKKHYTVLKEQEDGTLASVTAFDYMRGYVPSTDCCFDNLSDSNRLIIQGMCLALDSIQSTIDKYNAELATTCISTMNRIELECKIEALDEATDNIWLNINNAIIQSCENNFY